MKAAQTGTQPPHQKIRRTNPVVYDANKLVLKTENAHGLTTTGQWRKQGLSPIVCLQAGSRKSDGLQRRSKDFCLNPMDNQRRNHDAVYLTASLPRSKRRVISLFGEVFCQYGDGQLTAV